MAFYKTQIKTISGGVATDVSGKKLVFMANYPCKEGDYVWTDGQYIFGNVSVKSSPVIFDIKSGIPVLADNLRGYFDSDKFKNYKVAQDNWVVNSHKKYQHGNEDNIIDAEFSNDGKLFKAFISDKKGLSAKWINSLENITDISDATISLFKDDTLIETINLAKYLPYFANTVSSSQGISGTIKIYVGGFKIDSTGKWDAIFCVDIDFDKTISFNDPKLIYHKEFTPEEFLEENFDFANPEKGGKLYLNRALIEWWQYLFEQKLRYVEVEIYKNQEKPKDINFSSLPLHFLIHDKYIEREGDIDSDTITCEITKERNNTSIITVANLAVAEGTKLKKINTTEYKHDDWIGTVHYLSDAYYGYIKFNMDATEVLNAFPVKARTLNNVVMTVRRHELLKTSETDEKLRYPVYFYFFYEEPEHCIFNIATDDEFFYCFRFVDSTGNYDFCWLTFSGNWKYSYIDFKEIPVRSDTGIFESFNFPVQDNFSAEVSKNDSVAIYHNGGKICVIDDADNFNFSAANVGKDFLIGVHGDRLFKANGALKTLDDNFKNFRLRKLKNISKSKK